MVIMAWIMFVISILQGIGCLIAALIEEKISKRVSCFMNSIYSIICIIFLIKYLF